MYSWGGTQSVIRVIRDNKIGADQIRVFSTWNGPGPARRGHVKNLFLTARSAVALTRASRTTIVHFHMTNGGAWLREGALIRLARARGFRVIVTIHGYDFPEFAQSYPRIVGTTLNHANHVILLSEEARAAAVGLVPSVPTSVVANPIAIDREAPGAARRHPWCSSQAPLVAGKVSTRLSRPGGCFSPRASKGVVG